MSGKGSKPRPFSVTREQYEDNWEKIFGLCKKCGKPHGGTGFFVDTKEIHGRVCDLCGMEMRNE